METEKQQVIRKGCTALMFALLRATCIITLAVMSTKPLLATAMIIVIIITKFADGSIGFDASEKRLFARFKR